MSLGYDPGLILFFHTANERLFSWCVEPVAKSFTVGKGHFLLVKSMNVTSR